VAERPTTEAERALASTVFADGAYRPFAELTDSDAEARAGELRPAGEFGHGRRVAAVAMAWRELAVLMRKRGAARVADLDDETVERFAQRLWIVPPGGSLLP
jgi:hypothetical protein